MNLNYKSITDFDDSDDILKVGRLIKKRINATGDDEDRILKIKLFILTNKELGTNLLEANLLETTIRKSKGRTKKTKTKKKFSMGKFQEQSSLFMLCIPALLCFIIWNYVPMFGLIIAFKDYTYDAGILGSEWVGFYKPGCNKAYS